MMRRVMVFLVAVLVAYFLAGLAYGADAGQLPLPRPDWWDLIAGVIGAVVGWLSRWLQDLARRRPPGGFLPPDR